MSDQVTKEQETPDANEPTRAKTQKLSAHYALPGSSPDTLVKIIKGYAVASNGGESQVNYKDVASATGLAPSMVSRNNLFLAEAQIIVSPKYGFYIPSEAAVKFAREAAWDEPNAKRYLRTTVSGTWFGTVVTQNFMTRPSLSRDELKRVLAIKSGASEGDAESLSRLIDFLAYINFISENEHGGFTRLEATDSAETGRTISVNVSESARATDTVGGTVQVSGSLPQGNPGGAHVTFQINLNVNVGNLRDLTDEDAATLRTWIQGVLRP